MAIQKRAIAAATTDVKEDVKAAPAAEVKKTEEKAEAPKAAAPAKAAEKKPAAKKTSTAKKPAAKKSAAKKTDSAAKKSETATKTAAKKTTTAKKPAAKKTSTAKKPAAKKAPAKKAASVSENMVVQFRGREVSTEQIRERFNDVWTKDYGRKASDVKEVTFYIKPEDSAVYFAVNNGEDTGSFAI